jgi:uncharacterized repeat protein (TIGR01451 family)
MTLVEGTLQGSVSGINGRMVSRGADNGAVQWVVTNLSDGESATLSFRARVPFTLEAGSTQQLFVNRAEMLDTELEGLTYGAAVPGHKLGEQVYSAAEYGKVSGATYHRALYPMLTVEKSADRPGGSRVMAGDVLTYTVKVSNGGQDEGKNVMVKDPIPAGLEYVADSATSSAAGTRRGAMGSTVTWIIPGVGVGETVTLTLRARVLPREGTGFTVYNNVAYAREAPPAGNPEEELAREWDNPVTSNPTDHYQMIGARITARKINSDGDRLEGATIEIRQVEAGDAHSVFDTCEGETNGDGEIEFADIPVGSYEVYETQAPEGYAINPIRLSVVVYEGTGGRRVTIVDQLLTLRNVTPMGSAGNRTLGDSPI